MGFGVDISTCKYHYESITLILNHDYDWKKTMPLMASLLAFAVDFL